jgi:methylphosphotriester-DNA--protein-cysteine methyltransferase
LRSGTVHHEYGPLPDWLEPAVQAVRCGFKTAHHFSRRIKQATGLSPATFRRERWAA